MSDINKEYADLYEKYGYLWADSFNKVQGRGWNLLPVRPKNMEERNRVFADFVKKGYAVHTDNKYGKYYIYTYKMKTTEIGGRENKGIGKMPGITQEYSDLYEKYGPVWADAFNKVRGRGWNLLPVMPITAAESFKVFVDYARKGYEVYVEPRNVEYFIYVNKPEGAGGRVSERYVSESRAKPEGWQGLIDSLRITYLNNFKLVIDEVRRRFPSVPEKDIVDYIIKKYIGAARLRKAVYKPENRLVNVWSISQTPTSFLVESVGIRNYTDLSFDPVNISALEKTGMYPPEHVVHIDVIKEIIRGYRLGYTDAAIAIDDINEVVERM